ncbi:MAG: hypothetical protein R2848_16425 [Thermomicrobiales bacterium]
MANLRQQIATEAQAGMDRQQRDHFLREQIRAIQKRVGLGLIRGRNAGRRCAKIEEVGMPGETKQKALVQWSGWNWSNGSLRPRSGSFAGISSG